jgi:hypothetical protein
MTIQKLEYRVVPVTRYVITRYVEQADGSAASSPRGEFDNADQAYETAYALCKLEHEHHTDIPAFDDRVQYPKHSPSASMSP